jgi:hypothetical protein
MVVRLSLASCILHVVHISLLAITTCLRVVAESAELMAAAVV